jgi:hypothetical protein
MTLSEQIRRLAARTVGMTTDLVAGYTATAVCTAANKLVDKGELHKVKVSRRCSVFFTNPGLADALRERLRTQREEEAKMRASGAKGTNYLQRAPWRDDTPAIVPAGLVVQVCPAFTPRHAEVPLPGAVVAGLQRGRVTRQEAAETGFAARIYDTTNLPRIVW